MSPGTDVDRARQLRLLIDSVADYAIFLLEIDGRVATWNPGAERIKGYKANEIIGRHFSTFYTDVDRDRRYPEHELEVAAEVGRFEDEGWRVRKDGTQFWANVVITAIRDETGELVGFGKVTRDLTDRRRRETELQRFAAMAAHDLAEPLRTVAGFAELLRRRHAAALPPEAEKYL